IPDLSSDTIEEFLKQRSIELRWWPQLVAWESRLIWLLSWVSILVSIFNYMLSFVTLMFTGHLGSLELAGASMAIVGIQVGDGKCSANSVWRSIWGKKILSNGHHIAKSNHLTLGGCSDSHISVLVFRVISESHRSVREHSRERSSFFTRNHSSTLCICSILSYAEVPPSTEHCEPSCIHVTWGVPSACASHLVGSLCIRLWTCWSCSYSQLLMVVSCLAECFIHHC
ncbi:hypothetical protein V8G54_034340, partial [Vigna mungo]